MVTQKLGDLIRGTPRIIEDIKEAIEENKVNEIIKAQTTFQKVSLSNNGLNPKKPAPTFYNSQLGTLKIGDTTYSHGSLSPNGDVVHAPILDDPEWSYLYETFNYPEEFIDRKGNTQIRMMPKPAILNKLDVYFTKKMRENQFVLLLAYRESHKSTNLTRYVKRECLDFGSSVTYYSSTNDMAKDYTRNLKDQIQGNENILRDYGYILNDKSKNTESQMNFLTSQTASRQSGISSGSAQGRSQMGGHPDILALDDVIGEEQEGSPAQLKKILKWFLKQVWPMAKGSTKVIIVGTMKDPEDLYNYIIEKKFFEVVRVPAIREWPNNGQTKPLYSKSESGWYYVEHKGKIRGVANIIGGHTGNEEIEIDFFRQNEWNTPGRVQYYNKDDPKKGIDGVRMSLQEFLLIRHIQGGAYFEYEFQLNAVPVDEGYLAWDNIKWFDGLNAPELPLKQYLESNVNVFFDQSMGTGNRADLNVIAVVAEYEEHTYLLEMWAWRGGGVGKKVEMLELCWRMFGHCIIKIGVEADLSNSGDMKYLETYFPELPIEPIYQRQKKKVDDNGMERPQVVYKLPNDIPPNKRTKCLRILSDLDAPMEQGTIHANSRIKAIEHLMGSRNFPKCKEYDPLDAWSSGKFMCMESMGEGFFWEHG